MAGNLKELIYESRDQFMLFDLLDDDDVDRVIPYLQVVDYPKGAVLYKEGELGNFIGFITSGKLEVKKETEFRNKQIVLATLGKGSFVGEMSFIGGGQPRSVSVIALENSELIIMSRDALDAVTEKHPGIAIKILKGLTQILVIRLRKTIERLAYIF